jgi:hypothetical protein
MIERLVRGPASVSELAEPLDMSLPAVMQHLRVLESCGLVRSEKQGRVRTCQIEPARCEPSSPGSSPSGPSRRGNSMPWATTCPTSLPPSCPTSLPPSCPTSLPTRPPSTTRIGVKHHHQAPTFTVERVCPAEPARDFAARSDPVSKARWFAGLVGSEHKLGFRAERTRDEPWPP